MMSPIGMPIPPESSRLTREDYGYLAGAGHDWVLNQWDSGNFSPFDAGRILGGALTKPIIHNSIQRRMNLQDEREKAALADYIH